MGAALPSGQWNAIGQRVGLLTVEPGKIIKQIVKTLEFKQHGACDLICLKSSSLTAECFDCKKNFYNRGEDLI